MNKRFFTALSLSLLMSLLCGCSNADTPVISDESSIPGTTEQETAAPTEPPTELPTLPPTEAPTDPNANADMSTWDSAYTHFLVTGQYHQDRSKECDKASAALVYLTYDEIPELVVIHDGINTVEDIFTYDPESETVYRIARESVCDFGSMCFLPYKSAYSIQQGRGSFKCCEVSTDKKAKDLATAVFPEQGAWGGKAPKQPDDEYYLQFSVVKDTSYSEKGSTDKLNDEWVKYKNVEFYTLDDQSPENAIGYLKDYAVPYYVPTEQNDYSEDDYSEYDDGYYYESYEQYDYNQYDYGYEQDYDYNYNY